MPTFERPYEIIIRDRHRTVVRPAAAMEGIIEQIWQLVWWADRVGLQATETQTLYAALCDALGEDNPPALAGIRRKGN